MKKNTTVAILIGILIIALSIFVGMKVMGNLFGNNQPEEPGVVTELPQVPDNQEDKPQVAQQPKEYVPVVFIGRNNNGEEVYKVVKREYDETIDGTKLRFALTSLIMGPKPSEKQTGIYSEVPSSTNILHVYDKGAYTIVDLSSGFTYGGGTESIYKRIYQLIKTVKRNADKPVYLYIDGRQADVIGGDGIMITQPLSEDSIGE